MDRRRLGKFDVLCRLSTGGMSEIYLAQQGGVGGFNKLVVLKTILPDISGEEDFVRMFLDEARTTAAFNHPNIAQVYELDTADGVLFMAMEFVQGCTLVEMARACRQAKETIPIGFTLAAVRDTALALHYAHSYVDPRGRRQIVIHRDVAEKNVMVTYEGVTKLLDFGIAKALGRSTRTSVGMVKGTSGYMSPEQIRGDPLDPRSDIFSLGVVMHECLTGLRLFHGKNAEEGMVAALKGDVVPPSKWNPQVPPEIDALVMRALQKDREGRFGTALEFARAIEKAAPGGAWHPEQTGELVVRHFAERRAETRRTLDNALGTEHTGEIRVQSLIARMKADEPKKATPAKPQAAHLVVPQVPLPMVNANATQPGISPYKPAGKEPTTSPARPKVLRSSASAPAARPVEPAMAPTPQNDFDEDESDAKTIPAAALPEEIRQLRKRMLEDANKRTQQATPQHLPTNRRDGNDVESSTVPINIRNAAASAPPLEVTPGSLRTVPPPTANAPGMSPVPASLPATPKAPAPIAPPRTESGETLSITHRADWNDDDDHEVLTVAGPGPNVPARPVPEATRAAPEPRRPSPAPMQARSSGKLRPVPHSPGRIVLVVVLVLLLALALLGGLVLFDVLPGIGRG